MRAPHQLLHSRTRVRPRYALLPIEGYPPSKLPLWPESEAFVLAAPALGAEFAQYLLKVTVGRGTKQKADGRIETFVYVLDGEFKLTLGGGSSQSLTSGGFALVTPTDDFRLDATQTGSLLLLRKAYETAPGIAMFASLVGHERDAKPEPFNGDDGALLQSLIPGDLPFDMAMNIFTFHPGHSLPYVETHVMEHGLYFLEGKGVYYLDDTWMEVEATDFIWMGPYVPQSFYATEPVPSKYIYYKNVNRDVKL